MSKGVAGRRAALLLLAAGMTAAACDTGTDVEDLTAGSVSFRWAVEGGADTLTWIAEGDCGERGFDLSRATCAVGSDEQTVWVALAVSISTEETYDKVTLLHPPEEGACAIHFTPGTQTTCTVEFLRGTSDFPVDPYPAYVMTSGTITTAVGVDENGDTRLTGTFEGRAEDFSELQLAPIAIVGGTFDVDFAGHD